MFVQDQLDSSCSIEDSKLAWADGVIVVYDVGEMSTFQHARTMVNRVISSLKGKQSKRKGSKVSCKPLLLIGNKADLWVISNNTIVVVFLSVA